MEKKPTIQTASKRKDRKGHIKAAVELHKQGKLLWTYADGFYTPLVVEIDKILACAVAEIKPQSQTLCASMEVSGPVSSEEELVEDHPLPMPALNKSQIRSVMRSLHFALTNWRPEIFELLARTMRIQARPEVKELGCGLLALFKASDDGPVNLQLLARELVSQKMSEEQGREVTLGPINDKSDLADPIKYRVRTCEKQLRRYAKQFRIPYLCLPKGRPKT